MAVSQDKVKERLKALFPGVNLSKKRLDELSARLSQKPADDADDEAIDSILTTANDFIPFADIAREDDRVRTLEANQKKKDPEPAPQPAPTPPADDTPAWAKALLQKVEALETEKKQTTIQQQLKEKLKDVDADFYKYAALPQSVEELDAFAEGIKTDYTNFKQRIINGSVGDGKVPQGGGTSKNSVDASVVAFAKQQTEAAKPKN